jgi:hypothetical protein
VGNRTEDFVSEDGGDLRTAKETFMLPFLSVLVSCVCAPAGERKTSLEILFKKIDHFMVGKYEVGALEYEPYMLL